MNIWASLIWSLGCIMAEMILKKPLFNVHDKNSQLEKIRKKLGDFDTEPGIRNLFGLIRRAKISWDVIIPNVFPEPNPELGLTSE